MNYRYQPLAQNMLDAFPYSVFRLLDKQTDDILEISPWEVMCNQEILTQVDPKYYPMICVSAADNEIKDRHPK